MNKKQLTLQNASLFAELERKMKEIEIQNIRLEESEQKISALSTENEALNQKIEKADAENKKLFEKIQYLEAALAEAEARATESATVINEAESQTKFELLGVENTEETTENTQKEPELNQIDLEIQQEISKALEMADTTESVDTNDEIEKVKAEESSPTPTPSEPDFDKDAAEDTVTEILTPPTAFEVKKAEPPLHSADLLRDYGARTIGKVTRVTAEVLSKINATNSDASESLKTLALGKNESFKFQIMELAKSKGDPEKAIAEMDLLADEAIVYLRSI